MSQFLKIFLLIGILFQITSPIFGGVTRSYSLTVKEKEISPDGVKKTSLLYNDVFPGPLLTANIGDNFQISVTNSYSEPTALHTHGMFQRGTQWSDGANQITQCPILPNATQVYNFNADQSGTYWYHAHYHSQYTDGLVGPLIITDPSDPARYGYDGEILVVISDWYHTDHNQNENFYLSTGVPPFPFSPLINGRGQFPCLALINYLGDLLLPLQQLLTTNCYPDRQTRSLFRVQPGKTIRVRVINTSAMSAFTFSVDGHKLRGIEVDGVSAANPSAPVDYTVIGAAQRYSFLLTTDQTISQYKIRAVMKTDFIPAFGSQQNLNVNVEKTLRPVATAILKYDPTLAVTGKTTEETSEPYPYFSYKADSKEPQRSTADILNEMTLLPADLTTAPSNVDYEFTLNVGMTATVPPRTLFDGKQFSLPEGEPLLATWFKGNPLPDTANPMVVDLNKSVQIIINNNEPLQHPIHLHGHTFFVVGKGAPFAGAYNASIAILNMATVKRDTVLLDAMSWVVLRVYTDNPGVWSMHCHIDWHNAGGMVVTLVEGQVGSQTIPEEAKRICAMSNIQL